MRLVVASLTACICIALGALYIFNRAEPHGLKSATEFTPSMRSEERHAFGLEDAVSQPTQHIGQTSDANLKVGFVFSANSQDFGFTYSHNQGRLALSEQLGIETIVVDGLREDNPQEALESLVTAGCKVIFSCSYDFIPHVVLLAKKYSDIYFINCAGMASGKNLANFFGRMYQVRYLTGIVAGLRTRTNKLGYVAAFPVPEVIRGANAFALGVKSVNPEAKIYIDWTHAWYDPGKARAFALSLIDRGCDVIAQHQDSVSPQVAAEERGVWSIGYHASMEFFAPNAYLTGASWNWAPYFINQVTMVQNGTWTPSNYWGGLEDDVVRLDPLTAHVAPGTQEAVNKAIAAIRKGFDIFVGPLHDNTGALRAPKGHTMTDDEKLSMMWLVDNIVGSVTQ